MGRVFPHIPDTTYTIIIEGKPRVRVWNPKKPLTSLKAAREEGKRAREKVGEGKRILILAYEQRRVAFTSRKHCWEVK